MNIRPQTLFLVIILVSDICLASDGKKQFDLHVSVPKRFSYVSLSFPAGPIDRYVEGYTKGFREALERFRDNKEMIPEKVSGHGEFISGHYEGFKNASAQLLKLKKELSKKEINNLIKNLLEPE